MSAMVRINKIYSEKRTMCKKIRFFFAELYEMPKYNVHGGLKGLWSRETVIEVSFPVWSGMRCSVKEIPLAGGRASPRFVPSWRHIRAMVMHERLSRHCRHWPAIVVWRGIPV